MAVTDTAAMNELLEDSLEHAIEVTVTVSACEYKCCGYGFAYREYDGPQRYTGRVLSINVDAFLMQVGNTMGKMAEVIADFDHLISVDAS